MSDFCGNVQRVLKCAVLRSLGRVAWLAMWLATSIGLLPSLVSAADEELLERIFDVDVPSQAVAPESIELKKSPPAVRNAGPRRVIDEIVVTANRREQNLQDVGGGIAVFDGDDLEQRGVEDFDDYIFSIPGMDFASNGQEQRIAIRGVANVVTNPGGLASTASPVGIYLNDAPIQGNGLIPDLTLYDLDRIEVLKGPQGTLYGEGAQGGALKMLLNTADPSAWSAKGEVSFGLTRFAGGSHQSQSLALNAPLTESWALRLVGSRKLKPGYVDFPERGTRNEDDSENLMGRLHLDGELFGFSVSGMVLHQRQRLDQFPQVQLDRPDLTNFNSEAQFAQTKFSLGSVSLEREFDFAQLTSSTSVLHSDRDSRAYFPFINLIVDLSLTPLIGRDGAALLLDSASPAENEWLTAHNVQFVVAEELRLVSSGDSSLRWIAGAFFRMRENDYDTLADNDAEDSPEPAGSGVLRQWGTESFTQFSGFGEVTLDLPFDLELGAGLRLLHETAQLRGFSRWRGPLYPLALAGGGEDGVEGPVEHETATLEFTPRVSLNWYVDDERMLYILAANGVRSGGTNPAAVFATVTPLYDPDSLWSYEAGFKSQWLGRLLTFNLAAFYNDWKDLQVATVDPDATIAGGVPFATPLILNVGEAYSAGVEIELLAQPLDGLDLTFSAALMTGAIDKGDPEGEIPDGTKLPQLSPFGYAASVTYVFPGVEWHGFAPLVAFDTQRTGKRFLRPGAGALAPFQLYNLRAGLSNERWDLSLNVRNLTDVRPQLGSVLVDPGTLTIGAPRTWTVRLGFRFD